MIAGILLGILIGATVVGCLVFQNQGRIYSDILERLEHDRDQARAEAATFRRMIIPRFDVASCAPPSHPFTVSGVTPPESGAVPPSASAPAPQPFRNRPISTRDWMKQMGTRFNSKQQRVDAIAQQISSQEKVI
jgi:hypothetical protein